MLHVIFPIKIYKPLSQRVSLSPIPDLQRHQGQLLPHGTTQGGQHRPGHKDLPGRWWNPQSVWNFSASVSSQPTLCCWKMRSTVLNLSQIQWFGVSLHIIALLSAAKSPSQWASCHRLPSPHTESEPPFPHAPPAKRSPSQWAAPSTAAGDATYNNSQPQADPAGMENDQPTLWIYERSSLGGLPLECHIVSTCFNICQPSPFWFDMVWHFGSPQYWWFTLYPRWRCGHWAFAEVVPSPLQKWCFDLF